MRGLAIVMLAMAMSNAQPVAAAEDVTQCNLVTQAASTCRIFNSKGEQGTGCVFEIRGDAVYIITAAHVVDAGPTVQCEFWWGGHKSKQLPAQVYARLNEDVCDAAILKMHVSQFDGRLPVAIPFAPRGSTLHQGETITWMGCPNNQWATAVVGHAAGYFTDQSRFVFRPSPANGRSGSAILNADGTAIVGLLHARTRDDCYGIAITSDAMYQAFDAKVAAIKAQCGPQGCPPSGQCDPNQWIGPDSGGARRMLPGPEEWPRRIPRGIIGIDGIDGQRQPPQPQQPQQGGQVYPSLPAFQQQAPMTVDLSGVETKLDKLEGSIAMLVEELRAANPPPVAEAPLPVAPVEPIIPALTAVDLAANNAALLEAWKAEQAEAAAQAKAEADAAIAAALPPPTAMVGPIPVAKITEAVTAGADAAIAKEGSLVDKSRTGGAAVLDSQTKEGSVTDIALYVLLTAVLGGWLAKIVFPFTRWGKNKAFTALGNLLDPDFQNTPQEERVAQNLQTIFKPIVAPGAPETKTV